jgi:hypothetical protein
MKVKFESFLMDNWNDECNKWNLIKPELETSSAAFESLVLLNGAEREESFAIKSFPWNLAKLSWSFPRFRVKSMLNQCHKLRSGVGKCRMAVGSFAVHFRRVLLTVSYHWHLPVSSNLSLFILSCEDWWEERMWTARRSSQKTLQTASY